MNNSFELNVATSLGKKVYLGKIWIKLLLVAIVTVMGFMLGLYGATTLATEYGESTVSILDERTESAGISLCETADFANPTVRLNCPTNSSMTNISGFDLPTTVDSSDGAHNGENYIAYTFYVRNNGSESVNLKEQMVVEASVLGADEAIRVRVYKNGVAKTYAKISALGVPEYGTTAFEGDSVFTNTQQMPAGAINKFTIVIWLEGDDPECLDNIRGGAVNLSMAFSIEDESTE